MALVLIGVSLFLRYYNFAAHTPFDWDQDRDYQEVQKIVSGEPVVLGPIARGVGGFYLGSLYYYLLVPLFMALGASLSALPLTSIALDVAMVTLIFLTITKIASFRLALTTSVLWAFSWFLISASRISWNVALVPLWSLGVLYSTYFVITKKSKNHLYLLGLLFGLSWHIHVAAIPVVPLLLLFFLARIRYGLSTWIKTGLFGIIPLIPLIIYDVNHGYLNAHLLRFQLRSQLAVSTDLLSMAKMVLTKLGKLTSGLFFGLFRDNLALGILTFALGAKAYFRDQRLFVKIPGAVVIIMTILVIALRDYNFPEYYFGVAYLSILILGATLVHDYLPRLLPIFVLIFIFLNLQNYLSAEPGGYSLANKEAIVKSLRALPQPLDVHYDLDPGREGGLRQLVDLEEIELSPSAKNRVIITDKINYASYIEGELATDQVVIGDMKSALYIVQ